MDRRGFLVRTGLTVAAAALASGPTWDWRSTWAQPIPTDDWAGVRALFALTPDWAHLGGNLLASHPTPVRAAIERHRAALDANPVHYLHENQGQLEADVLRAA